MTIQLSSRTRFSLVQVAAAAIVSLTLPLSAQTASPTASQAPPAGKAQKNQHAKADAHSQRGRNVILVVSDGLRWQEVFRGANPEMYTKANKVTSPSLMKAKWGGPNDQNRRAKLMPFLWSTVASRGELFGNRDLGSIAHVSNNRWFSYPGYNELITGAPDDSIDSNKKIPNKNVNVFEWLNNKPELHGKVAVFGAWAAFPAIFNQERSKLKVEAGKGDPYDAFKDYLKSKKPRVMFLGFGATDHEAHQGNYPGYLKAAHRVDRCMGDLWKTLQSMPEYRDNTTIIFSCDHGRGNSATSPKSWNSHGRSVPGADSIFVVVMGPDTPPLGEVRGGPEVIQAQVAATVAQAVGYDYPAADPKAAPPIPGAVVRR